MPTNWSGRQLGDFVIEERIARGGMSTIYRARQVSVNRFVAIKIIDLGDDILDREQFRPAFEQEAATAAALEHMHILPVYGFGIVDDSHAYIAMRLLTGGSLADWTAAAPAKIAEILFEVAQALDYAHRKGVMHGDLKPSNILLDEAGNPYLSDFSVAHVISASVDLGRSASMNVLPLYQAPEVVRGEAGDSRADIYSLGAVLYFLLTGQPPFQMDESGLSGLVYRLLEQDPAPPSTINGDLPSALDGVVMRALRKAPGDRYTTAAELAAAFNTAIGRVTAEWRLPAANLPPPRSYTRRAWYLPAAVLIVTLVLGVVLLARSQANSPATPPPIVQAGVRAGIHDVQPSPQEIELARARLGEDGFIAYLNCALNNVAEAAWSRRVRERADQLGLNLQVYDAENDEYLQLAQIERARAEGAQALIICPTGTTSMVTAADELQAANIPLVWVTLFDTDYGVKLDSDNYAIGERVGRYTGELLNAENGGQGNVIIISRSPFPASQIRANGMIDGLAAVAPGTTIVQEFAAGAQSVREIAAAAVAGLLEQGTVPDAIMCINDACAYGAIDSLTQAGVDPGDVIIVSVGAEPGALDLIRAGTYLRGTVAINWDESSALMLHALIKMLAGSPIPEFLTYSPGLLLTRDNVDNYSEE